MQVILLEKIRNLGDLGDTVKVKSGYGRNFLIPQGKAAFASEENLAQFEERRAELEKKAQDKLDAANARAEKLQALSLNIEVLASDEGKLYGSVGPSDVMAAVESHGLEVARREVVMPNGPIHEVGDHDIDIIVHSDVTVTLTLSINKLESNKE